MGPNGPGSCPPVPASRASGARFAHASRIRLIAGPLLEPVLTVSGLSGITAMGDDCAGEPQ